MENSQKNPVTRDFFTIRHWRNDSSSSRNTEAVAIAVDVLVVIAGLVSTCAVRKKETKKTYYSNSHSQNQFTFPFFCNCSSLSFLPPLLLFFVFSLQPHHILLSPPVSFTCPSPTSPLLCSFFFPPDVPFSCFFYIRK